MPNSHAGHAGSRGNNPRPLPRPPRPGERDSVSHSQQGNPGGNRPPNQAGGGQGGGGNSPPSPWLGHPSDPNPQPDPSASFIEYLRWMRVPEGNFKDGTKVDLVHRAEKSNIRSRLQTMNVRTRLMAGEGNTFEVACPWRIRVGGSKGPESMLLPAFDHLGIPYIPSSTLQGVARAQAIREKMEQEHLSWEKADKAVAPWFGHLEAQEGDRSGKVVFLDAYPVPKPGDPDNSKTGGLAVDIVNNIWSWDGNNLKYSPNPNVFFSLKQATFLIGIRKGPGCTDEMLAQVKTWLIKGLEKGAGSQINSGYGRLRQGQGSPNPGEFLRLPFELEGQLIHGRQKFTQWTWNQNRQEWQYRGAAEAEVRPVAFKNMLRYWFRTFALGVLPANQVQDLEGQLFGAITPSPKQGWIRVEIFDGRLIQPEPQPNQQGKRDPVGKQAGTLVLSLSQECPDEKKEAVKKLLINLTWMLFHLGGVGQGARRPCYSRKTRPTAPWWRGSTLIPQSDDKFWELPESVGTFKELFQTRINDFFTALKLISGLTINPKQPKNAGQVSQRDWPQAVDASCRIVVCSGEGNFGKPYALAVLHRLGNQGGGKYDKNLCGGVQGGVVPSPVWIADLGD
ncbi:MAG: RAMP superfamily CRISPR-associated protein, partial [Cyanobacteriota bacterium]